MFLYHAKTLFLSGAHDDIRTPCKRKTCIADAVDGEPVENPRQTMANPWIPIKAKVLRKTSAVPNLYCRKLVETRRKSMGSDGLPRGRHFITL